MSDVACVPRALRIAHSMAGDGVCSGFAVIITFNSALDAARLTRVRNSLQLLRSTRNTALREPSSADLAAAPALTPAPAPARAPAPVRAFPGEVR